MAANHGQTVRNIAGEPTPTSTSKRSGNMPQASSAIVADIGAAPSSRARRAAPSVVAVLETNPPSNPVASVPARRPSSACAM